jgi:asparagine synthase (glutamine-hydrolysing)
MSGIAGIINFDGKPIAPGWIETMTSAMSYRGPDGISHWRGLDGDKGVALGHCMLQTTPESLQEHQPVISEDGIFVLVMDGRVDNWLEVRRTLLSKDITLRNRSDAELVLCAFQCWGQNCLTHIEGDFALAIWNIRNRTLFCARDSLGIKPFHYYWSGTSLVFASDLHAILALPDVPEVPNEGVIAECLADDWCSRDETFWQGMLCLVAAHRMLVDDSGPKISQYWSPDLFATLGYKQDDEYTEHYRELFKDTVRRLSRSHKPIAVDVSGGLDSSAIFAMAEHLRREGQLAAPGATGYTLNFEGDPYADEIAYARAVGTHLDKPIVEVAPAFPPLSWYQEAAKIYRDIPGYPNTTMAQNEMVAVQASGSRVLIDGIGGDEWLGAGSVHYQDELCEMHFREVMRLFQRNVKDNGLKTSLWWLLRSAGVVSMPEFVIEFARKMKGKNNVEVDGRRWLTPELHKLLSQQHASNTLHPSTRVRLPSQRGGLAMLKHAFIAKTHQINDRYSASFGIEARRPYYTQAMVQFSFVLPKRLMFSGGVNKHTHRQAMQGLLPDVVLKRSTEAEFSSTFKHHLSQSGTLLAHHIPLRRQRWIEKNQADLLISRYSGGKHSGLSMWLLWSLFACDSIFPD